MRISIGGNMGDVMVTGRMRAEKKRAGNLVLEQAGVSTSAAIGLLYDYIIENQQMPDFERETFLPLGDGGANNKNGERKIANRFTDTQIKSAVELVDSIPITNEFSSMSDDEARNCRLKHMQKKHGGEEP